MSDADEGGLSSEAQEQQPAMENQQPDTAYEQQAHMQQAAFLASLKGKKKYTPPMPDENTFDTQEEFVKSLVPVPISSIPEVDRKCPHCWKRFGETDPGYDNAEDPVKFRCGHAFGEKCMKEVFRLPIPVKVELHPLSFGSGSRGAKLVSDTGVQSAIGSALYAHPNLYLKAKGLNETYATFLYLLSGYLQCGEFRPGMGEILLNSSEQNL